MFYYFLRGGFRWGPPLFLLPLSLFGQFVGQEQGVETGFVDDGWMLFSTHGVTNRYPIALELILVIDVVGQCFIGIAVTQHLGHILANELRIVVDGGGFSGFACMLSSVCGHLLRFWAFMGTDRQQRSTVLSLSW